MADKHGMTEDKKILHDMGYAQELARSMNKFSNFAISFSIICILSGGINSLDRPRRAWAVPPSASAGPWVVIISGVFALALAQISSAYPTAGGLYHWGSILGNRFTAGSRPGSTCSASSPCWAPSTSAPSTSSSVPSARSSVSRTRSPTASPSSPSSRRCRHCESLRHQAHRQAHRPFGLSHPRNLGVAHGGLPCVCQQLRDLAALDLHQLHRHGRRLRRLACLRSRSHGLPARPAAAGLHHHRLRRLRPHGGRNPRCRPLRAEAW